MSELRDIKINIIEGKYKCTSAYKIPKSTLNLQARTFEEESIIDWLPCPKCKLIPLIWEFNNGSSTACGCGENEYRHFSIVTESIMSHVSRNDGSAKDYDSYKLKKNWNHWVETGEELETHEELRKLGRW